MENAKFFGKYITPAQLEDQINQAQPIMSCVLVSGERVQIVMPPATKREHISITIRKPSKIRYTIEDYKKFDSFQWIVCDKSNQRKLKQ